MKLTSMIKATVFAIAIGVIYSNVSQAEVCTFVGQGNVVTSSAGIGGQISFNGVYQATTTVVTQASLNYQINTALGVISEQEPNGNGTALPQQVTLNTQGTLSSSTLVMNRRGNYSNQAIKGTININHQNWPPFSGNFKGTLSCN